MYILMNESVLFILYTFFDITWQSKYSKLTARSICVKDVYRVFLFLFFVVVFLELPLLFGVLATLQVY